MSRLVAVNFGNIDPRTVGARDPINQTTVQIAIENLALVYDAITGDNTPPQQINHTGYDAASELWNGCLIGGSLVAQAMNLAFSNTIISEKLHILVQPVFIPRGEKVIRVEALFQQNQPAFGDEVNGGRPPDLDLIARIYPSTMNKNTAPLKSVSMARSDDGVVSADIEIDDAGEVVIVCLDSNERTVVGQFFLTSWNIYIPRMGPTQFQPTKNTANATLGTTASGGATVVDFTQIDSASMRPDAPLTAFHLSRLYRNANSIEEMLRAWPAGNGESLQLEDSATVHAFADHSQIGRPNEALVDCVLWAEAFGSIFFDSVISPSAWAATGITGIAAPYSLTTGFQIFREFVCMFPYGPGDNARLFCVLADLDAGSDTVSVRIECFDAGGSSAGAVTASATLSNQRYSVELTSIPYFAGEENKVIISVASTANKANGTVILGMCLYTEGT